MTPLSDLLLSIVPADSIPAYLKSYIPGVSPFSTWPVVSTVIVSYLVFIFTAREVMKDLPSFKLQTLFKFHNALLSAGSLVLLLLITEEVVSVWMNVGTYDSVCAPSSWTDVSNLLINSPGYTYDAHAVIETRALLHRQLLLQVL
jgi:fatty acid elongase 3